MKKLFGPGLAGLLAAALLCSAGATTVRPCVRGRSGPAFRTEIQQLELQQLLEMPLVITEDLEETFPPVPPNADMRSGSGLQQFLGTSGIDAEVS